MARCSSPRSLPNDVRLGDHADERVDVGHRAVDRLEPRGERGSAVAADGLGLGLVGAERDRRRRSTSNRRGEVHAVRVVDLVAAGQLRVGREGLARLAGDRPEGRLRCEAVRRAELVVARHAVVTAALDVDRAEVHDAAEALRQCPGRPGIAGCPAPGSGTGRCAAGCRSARRSCTRASRPMPCSSGPSWSCETRSGLKNATFSGTASSTSSSSTVDLDALRLQSLQLCRRVARGLGLELELTVDHAVRAVADDRELVAERGVDVRVVAAVRRTGQRPSAGRNSVYVMYCCSAMTTRRAIWNFSSALRSAREKPDDPVVLAREQRVRGGQRDVLVGPHVTGDRRPVRLATQPPVDVHHRRRRGRRPGRPAAAAGRPAAAVAGRCWPGCRRPDPRASIPDGPACRRTRPRRRCTS